MPGLRRASQTRLKGPPIYLSLRHAEIDLDQMCETSRIRGWTNAAVAVMSNHVHAVIGVMGDPSPDVLLRDLKSYASRALTASYGRPASGTWWTESGSRRRLPDLRAVIAGIRYVRNQERPLALRVAADIDIDTGD
jgi:hypothetical protein